MSPFVRATLWFAFGVIFGLLSIILILASSAIFNSQSTISKTTHSIDAEFITFLCVALMGGAGADYMLSVQFPSSRRLNVCLFILLITGSACFLFNPKLKPDETFVYWFTVGICIVTVSFCLWVKTTLFTKEKIHSRFNY